MATDNALSALAALLEHHRDTLDANLVSVELSSMSDTPEHAVMGWRLQLLRLAIVASI
jgi:hypothetical protein